MNIAPIPAARDPISQDSLARYRQLAERAKAATWAQEQLRKLILSAHLAGATVEPGPLALEVLETEQRRLTNEELVRILGLEAVEDLRSKVVPGVTRSLRVIDVPFVPIASARKIRRRAS